MKTRGLLCLTFSSGRPDQRSYLTQLDLAPFFMIIRFIMAGFDCTGGWMWVRGKSIFSWQG